MITDLNSLFASYGRTVESDLAAAPTKVETPVEPTPPKPQTRSVPELYSADDITAISPKANADVVQALVDSQGVLEDFGINTPDRVASFLGQTAHESAGFSAMREFAGGSAYEGRADLGNTSPGDGVKYKGRGIIQLTGKYNYDKYGKMIGEDLVNNPELASDPKTAVKIAAAYWKDRGLNEKADEGNFAEITRRIQGTSTDAYDSRLNYFQKAKDRLSLRELTGGKTKVDVPMFGALSEAEKNNIVKSIRANNPIYYDKNAKVKDPAALPRQANASLSDALTAAYEQTKYLDTVGGKGMLESEELSKAIKANKAASPKTAALFALAEKEGTIAAFKVAEAEALKLPNISLPVSSSDIERTVRQRAFQIEEEYNRQHYGNFSAGPMDAIKTALMYGASALGAIGGVASDPYSLAVNLVAPPLSSGSAFLPSLGKFLAKTGTAFGAEQVAVQSNRSELGLESGFAQGLTNTAAVTAANAAIATLPLGVGKLKDMWKFGSNKFGSEASKAAVELGKGFENTFKNTNPEVGKYLKRQMDDAAETAKKYNRNPYGSSVEAKQMFEREIYRTAQAFIKGDPVPLPARPISIPVTKVTKADVEQMAKALTNSPEATPYVVNSINTQIKDMTSFLKTEISKNKPEPTIPQSFVPVVEGDLPTVFKSMEEGEAFINTAKGQDLVQSTGAVLIDGPDGPILARPAQVYDTPSTLYGKETETVLADGRVVYGEAEDVATLSKFPQYSKTASEPITTPINPIKDETIPYYLTQKVKEMNKAFLDNPPNMESFPVAKDAIESSFDRIESIYGKDLVDFLKQEETGGFKELLDEIAELKELQKPEVLTCFTGVSNDV